MAAFCRCSAGIMNFLKNVLVYREYRTLARLFAQVKGFVAGKGWSSVKKTIAFSLVAAELLCSLAFDLPQTARGQAIDLENDWELVWSDEFDGETLDLTKWRSGGDYQRRGGYWYFGNAFVEEGNLILRTDYKENGPLGTGWYSGSIETRDLFEKKFGYFECRAICPGAEGLWAAFWMFSHGVGKIDGSGRDGAEIDIFESPLYAQPTKRNSVFSTIHFDGYGDEHQSTMLGFFKVPNLYTEYNTFGLEWNEDECIFYVNGVETDRIGGEYVSQVAEWILLSVEVNGNFGRPELDSDGNVSDGGANGLITNNSNDIFPIDFIVDYVRVYDRKN